MNFLVTLINGLSLGGVYALIALGYTMVYGIAKMLNFAHGDIIMVGGYTVLVALGTSGKPIFSVIACVAAIVVCCILGVTIEKVAYKPLRGASPLAVLITAIGVSYFLEGLAQIFFGTNAKFVKLAEMGILHIGGLSIGWDTVITLLVSAAIMAVLTLFVKMTKTGRAMVAVSEDKAAASLMGVNVNAIITVTFAIGSILAAVASIFYLMRYPTLNNTMGAMPGIKAFTAAVIGGIGSIPGAMIGGIVLGIIECVFNSTPLAPYTVAIEFAILIVLLLVRPNGILGKKRREKV